MSGRSWRKRMVSPSITRTSPGAIGSASAATPNTSATANSSTRHKTSSLHLASHGPLKPDFLRKQFTQAGREKFTPENFLPGGQKKVSVELPPEVLEPVRRQLGVPDCVLDVFVPEIGLQRAGVVAGIG
jgi:hypothetical protein